MIQHIPALRLNQYQVAQLITHLTAYRAYLWQQIIPTPERNQTVQTIQTLQGRLEQEQQQGHPTLLFLLNREEGHTLQQTFRGLIQVHGTAPLSEQRLQTLGDIANWRVLVERALRQTS